VSLQISNEKYLYYYSKRLSEFAGCCALWKTMDLFKTATEFSLKFLLRKGSLLILVLQIKIHHVLGEPGTEGHRKKTLTD